MMVVAQIVTYIRYAPTSCFFATPVQINRLVIGTNHFEMVSCRLSHASHARSLSRYEIATSKQIV